MFRYSTFLCFIFLLSSCKSNEIVTTYDNGAVKEKYEINDKAEMNGLYQLFSENGGLQEEANYSDGILNGDRKIYYDTGELEIMEKYVNGMLDGMYQVFHKNGKPMIESNYNKGILEGLLTKYYEDGNKQEEVNFANNEENGPFKEYYANGQVQWEGSYLNGDSEFGLLKQFDEQGSLLKKMMCDSMGVCQTIWTPEKGDIVPEKIKLSKS